MATTKKHQITLDHFERYKRFVEFWQWELGLNGWKIYVDHGGAEPDAFATNYKNTATHVSRICIATVWEDREPTDDQLKECALHEVMHLVTADLYCEARDRHATMFDIDAHEHVLVVRMTNYIMRMHGRLPKSGN